MQRAASGEWQGLRGSLCVTCSGDSGQKSDSVMLRVRPRKLLVARDSQTESLSDLLQSALLASPPGPDPQTSSFHQVTLWVPVPCGAPADSPSPHWSVDAMSTRLVTLVSPALMNGQRKKGGSEGRRKEGRRSTSPARTPGSSYIADPHTLETRD